MAKKVFGAIKERPSPVAKRTSIGLNNRPKNKHARKNFKRYVRQG